MFCSSLTSPARCGDASALAATLPRTPESRTAACGPALSGVALAFALCCLINPAFARSDSGRATGTSAIARAEQTTASAAEAARTARTTAQSDEAQADEEDDEDEEDQEDDGGDGGDDDRDPAGRWPTTYIDLETGWSSSPGNTLGFGRRNLRYLTGQSSRGLNISAPLTIELNDRASVFFGIDGSASATPGQQWSKFTGDSWTFGGSVDLIAQHGAMPTLSLSGSVSRPLEPPLPGVQTTYWSGGVDLDYALDDDETRGLTAGFSITRTTISARRAHIGDQYDVNIGGYFQLAPQVNVTAQAGVQHFAGASLTSVLNLRLKPVTTPYVQLEVEHVDKDDQRVFAVNLMWGWAPKPVIQLALSTPLYLMR